MPLYLFYGGPFGAIVAEQSQNEFLELGRQSRAIHFVEVELVLPWNNQVVEVLWGARLLKRENAVRDYKKNHAEWKHVHLGASIVSTLFDFGCHIGKRASVTFKTVNIFAAGKAKISNFKVKASVKDHVL